MSIDPLKKFDLWFSYAKDIASQKSLDVDVNAMSLSTVDKQCFPSSRMVLLKGYDGEGFYFYTNLESKKALDIQDNPNVALLFFWPHIGRQIRIRGQATFASAQESDDYFASRPYLSKIGAHASQQSREISEPLASRVVKAQIKFGKNVPRPPFWGGYKILPKDIEFWKEGVFRLHTREVYSKISSGGWEVKRLYP